MNFSIWFVDKRKKESRGVSKRYKIYCTIFVLYLSIIVKISWKECCYCNGIRVFENSFYSFAYLTDSDVHPLQTEKRFCKSKHPRISCYKYETEGSTLKLSSYRYHTVDITLQKILFFISLSLLLTHDQKCWRRSCVYYYWLLNHTFYAMLKL